MNILVEEKKERERNQPLYLLPWTKPEDKHLVNSESI